MVGDPDWVANTRAYQRELWTRVKGDPVLQDIPVLGPAVARDGSEAALGDLSDYLDRGNIHPYPGGDAHAQHRQRASRRIARVRRQAARGHRDPATTPTWSPPAGIIRRPSARSATTRRAPPSRASATESSAATSTSCSTRGRPPRRTRAASRRWRTPSACCGGTCRASPASWGSVTCSTPWAADSRRCPAPAVCATGWRAPGRTSRQLLLRSSDGRFSLVVWREVSVWDRFARRDIDPGTGQPGRGAGRAGGDARRFDPVESEAERQSWTEPRRMSIAVGGGPVVLRLSK